LSSRNYVRVSLSYSRRIQYKQRLRSFSDDQYRTLIVNQLNLPEEVIEIGSIREFTLNKQGRKYTVVIGYRALLISFHQVVTTDGDSPVDSLLSQIKTIVKDLQEIGEYVKDTVFSSENVGLGNGVFTLNWNFSSNDMTKHKQNAFAKKLGDFIWTHCIMDMWVYSQDKLRYETTRDSTGNLSNEQYYELSDRIFLKALLCQSVSILPYMPLPIAATEWVKDNLLLMDAFYDEIDYLKELESIKEELAKGLKWYRFGPSGNLERRRLELTNHVMSLKHKVGKLVKSYQHIQRQIIDRKLYADRFVNDTLIDVKKIQFPTTFITSPENHVEAMDVVKRYKQDDFLDFGLDFLQKEFEIQKSIGNSRFRNLQFVLYATILIFGVIFTSVFGGTDWFGIFADYLQVATFLLLVIVLWITMKRD